MAVHDKILMTSLLDRMHTNMVKMPVCFCAMIKSFHPSNVPVKTLFARKDPFSCTPTSSCKILWDLVGSCEILQESCRNFVQESCKIPAKSCKIPQDPAGSCKMLQDLGDLAGVQEKGPFLARSCKSVFTGMASITVVWDLLYQLESQASILQVTGMGFLALFITSNEIF